MVKNPGISLCVSILVACVAGGADAADVQPIDPATLPPTQAVDAPAAEHLFGNWDGLQDGLIRRGISVRIDAVTEFAANVSGGTQQTSSFANQASFDADINWERLANLTGFSSHLIIVDRSGSNTSHAFGDNLLPAQEIYGAGGDVALHLVSLFGEETLFDRRLDIAAGRMNVENDFASSPLYCNYLNNALCGDPKSLPGGDIGHSAYPESVWAARVRVRPIPDLYVATGVYEVNQGLYTDQYFRSGFQFGTSHDSGVYLPIEFGWEPSFGPDDLVGHYKLGFGYDSSAGHQDFANALANDGVPGYRLHSYAGNTQLWALADQMLVRHGQGDDEGLAALAGIIKNDPNNTVYADQYFVGLVDRGFWKARPKDGVAFLFTYVGASDRLAKVEAIEQTLELPFSNGATGIQSHEMLLELNYRIHVADGLRLRPDLQYVIRPNAQSNLRDAAVFAFRAYVDF